MEFQIDAQRRIELGTGASRRLRHAGSLPAVIYGGKKEPVSLTLSQNSLLKQLEHEAFYSRILTVNIDDQPEKAVLKALQRHPYRPLIMHVDFQRISETEKLQMRIPLHFVNADKCIGVKKSDGIISHQMAEVDIRCLPKDLPEFIEVDLTNIELNQIMHLSDLILPQGVELVALFSKEASHNLPVVSVHLARGTQADEEEDVAAAQEESTEEEKPKDK
ncbi:50S ribosomal protein L25/general stress protein Ctc [Candidatus Parabeggiatoa sp. HSG14]|uniref:50S ribosomal protein L25/general stress protein Ctc n=1 Tax=Candidatus Parabeggiatoa sp. HSG14 TaxID=3055593 RepID=UPI0025A80F40|nr:50S ribosomal protein L25/general stress protein Ctc [Thiotrichales bacterium HSG14]